MKEATIVASVRCIGDRCAGHWLKQIETNVFCSAQKCTSVNRRYTQQRLPMFEEIRAHYAETSKINASISDWRCSEPRYSILRSSRIHVLRQSWEARWSASADRFPVEFLQFLPKNSIKIWRTVMHLKNFFRPEFYLKNFLFGCKNF